MSDANSGKVGLEKAVDVYLKALDRLVKSVEDKAQSYQLADDLKRFQDIVDKIKKAMEEFKTLSGSEQELLSETSLDLTASIQNQMLKFQKNLKKIQPAGEIKGKELLSEELLSNAVELVQEQYQKLLSIRRDYNISQSMALVENVEKAIAEEGIQQNARLMEKLRDPQVSKFNKLKKAVKQKLEELTLFLKENESSLKADRIEEIKALARLANSNVSSKHTNHSELFLRLTRNLQSIENMLKTLKNAPAAAVDAVAEPAVAPAAPAAPAAVEAEPVVAKAAAVEAVVPPAAAPPTPETLIFSTPTGQNKPNNGGHVARLVANFENMNNTTQPGPQPGPKPGP